MPVRGSREPHEFDVLGGIRLMRLPEVAVVWLVPDLPVLDPIAKVLGQRPHKAQPRLPSLVVAKRHPANGELICGFRRVQPIAVARVEPGLDSYRPQAVDDRVEPGEIVFALGQLATRPAGLQPSPLGDQKTYQERPFGTWTRRGL